MITFSGYFSSSMKKTRQTYGSVASGKEYAPAMRQSRIYLTISKIKTELHYEIYRWSVNYRRKQQPLCPNDHLYTIICINNLPHQASSSRFYLHIGFQLPHPPTPTPTHTHLFLSFFSINTTFWLVIAFPWNVLSSFVQIFQEFIRH